MLIVGWMGEDDVKVGKETTDESDEKGAHAKDGANKTFVYKGVDAAIFDHS